MNKIYLNGKTYTYTSIIIDGENVTIDGKRVKMTIPKPAFVSSHEYKFGRE